MISNEVLIYVFHSWLMRQLSRYSLELTKEKNIHTGADSAPVPQARQRQRLLLDGARGGRPEAPNDVNNLPIHNWLIIPFLHVVSNI